MLKFSKLPIKADPSHMAFPWPFLPLPGAQMAVDSVMPPNSHRLINILYQPVYCPLRETFSVGKVQEKEDKKKKKGWEEGRDGQVNTRHQRVTQHNTVLIQQDGLPQAMRNHVFGWPQAGISWIDSANAQKLARPEYLVKMGIDLLFPSPRSCCEDTSGQHI